MARYALASLLFLACFFLQGACFMLGWSAGSGFKDEGRGGLLTWLSKDCLARARLRPNSAVLRSAKRLFSHMPKGAALSCGLASTPTLVYNLDVKRRDVIKDDLKKSFPMVPDMVMDFALNEITLLIGHSKPKDLEALLQGAPEDKRVNLRAKYAKILAKRIDIPFVMKEVEEEWLGAFIDKVFESALKHDQVKLTDAYLKAKLTETEDEDEEE